MTAVLRRRLVVAALLLACAFSALAFSRPDPLTLQRMLRQVARATYPTETVWHFRFLDNGDTESIQPSGMGVLLTDGRFLTVSHAVMSYGSNRRIYHNRRFERVSSETTLTDPRRQAVQVLEELTLLPALDLAVFALPPDGDAALERVALPLALESSPPLDGVVYLVRLRADAPDGYTVTQGRITGGQGHGSMAALGISQLEAFYMVEMEEDVLFGDSGSAVVGLPADNPQQLALYGIVSGSAGTRAAVLKADYIAPQLVVSRTR